MNVYFEEDIRRSDQLAQRHGLTLQTLMENAGRSLFEAITNVINKHDSICIVAGTGNNGGDGIVLTRYLKMHGYNASLCLPIGKPKTEPALDHLQYYEECGYQVDEWSRSNKYDVIIDALLGVGARYGLHGTLQEVVQWANQAISLRIAVDIPTGLTADSGYVDNAFCASYTFCLHGLKPSVFLEPSSSYYGAWKSVDIGLPQTGRWKVWTEEDVNQSTSVRSPYSHKGTYGTGLLVAGSDEMPGSAMLAALGAMRSGIGKLTVATTKFTTSVLTPRVPEATYWTEGLQRIANGNLSSSFRAAAIGPGIEDRVLVEQAVTTLLTMNIPVVLDAGALNKRTYPLRSHVTVVTPHPGEFSRMIDMKVIDIQANRITFASEYAKKHGVIVVLKGAYTVIAYPDGSGVINTTGNSGLAKGGTGDTLTGMLLAFLCTYENPQKAISNAVYIHGLCADEWTVDRAEATMLASDISNMLPYVLKRFER
ncbi:NAD(P)H-hydrate dehydratase [Ectobacillus sp. sgz5001026]|uniref:NAD(P)H-hydrate dehydratase n=1 Tax=Ectobacillus sp. sgz5001026 TaxID=3242473 RepID=UPI0036D425A0